MVTSQAMCLCQNCTNVYQLNSILNNTKTNLSSRVSIYNKTNASIDRFQFINRTRARVLQWYKYTEFNVIKVTILGDQKDLNTSQMISTFYLKELFLNLTTKSTHILCPKKPILYGAHSTWYRRISCKFKFEIMAGDLHGNLAHGRRCCCEDVKTREAVLLWLNC
jgi:hypothetical protein